MVVEPLYPWPLIYLKPKSNDSKVFKITIVRSLHVLKLLTQTVKYFQQVTICCFLFLQILHITKFLLSKISVVSSVIIVEKTFA